MTQWGDFSFLPLCDVWQHWMVKTSSVLEIVAGILWRSSFPLSRRGLTEMGDSFCKCHIFSSGKWKTEEVSRKKRNPAVETGGNTERERERQRQNILWDRMEEEGPLRPKRGIILSLSNVARPHDYIPSWCFIADIHYVSPRSFRICGGSC